MKNKYPLPLDPWTSASLMQKAIRRGEAELAAQAALAYHRMRGKMIWRRLIIIAFEDIGIANPELVSEVTRTCIESGGTDSADQNRATIETLARRMARSVKDRSADYLLSAIKDHPNWETHRAAIAALSIQDRIQVAMDETAPLPLRATASWLASGVNGGGPQLVGPGDLQALLDAFIAIGLPDDLGWAVEAAATRTKEPITLFLPLLWTVIRGSQDAVSILPTAISPAPASQGVPTWVLDKHTASGKRAISQFARENDAVRLVLEHHVPDFRSRDVALMAAFYADASVTDRQLVWPGSSALEMAGMEADMWSVRCPLEAAAQVVQAVRSNLDHLNAIRLRSMTATHRITSGLFEIEEAK